MTDHNKRKSIKDWAEDDQPREKLVNKGRETLSDAELLAILISTGTKEMSAVELGRNLLQKVNNNLADLSKLTIKEMMKNKGIGLAKAVSIVAALELGMRRRAAEVPVKQQVNSSRDAFEMMYPSLADLIYEEFWVLMLNHAHKKISLHQISEGGQAGTVVDPKKIFKLALEQNASKIILCHNHPSGNLRPSDADIKLTEKIKNAGIMLEIPVLDHLIIGDDNYYSFADNGLL